MYIRSEDSIVVEYLSTAEVELITGFCGDLSAVVTTFRELFEAGNHLKGYSSLGDKDVADVNHVMILFSSVAYTCLTPWGQVPTVEANRQLINQEGGVELTVELLSLLLEAPFSTLDNSLQMLMISCLSLMWNFAETRGSRCVVIRLGGFQLMMKALLLHKDRSGYKSKQFSMFDLFDHVVGCVSKYVVNSHCHYKVVLYVHLIWTKGKLVSIIQAHYAPNLML